MLFHRYQQLIALEETEKGIDAKIERTQKEREKIR
jgi:hypothetical protein